MNLSTKNKSKDLGGRPKLPKGAAKTKSISIKLTPLDYRIVELNAGKANLTIARYAREIIVGNTVKARMSESMISEIRKLTGMANNLNQLAHQANIGYIHELADNCNIVSLEVYKLIQYIRSL